MDAKTEQALLNPKHVVERDVQNLLEILNQASNVQRYSRDHMVKRESLLEHMGFVVAFAYVIGERTRQKGVLVSMSELLKKAVTHDLEEVLTGDIDRPAKYSSTMVTDGLKAYELRAITRLEEVLKIPLLETWSKAKDKSIEGRIVKLADFAAVVYKTMVEFSMLGNRSFLRVSQEVSEVMGAMLANADKDDPLLWVMEELSSILNRSRIEKTMQFGAFFKGF